MNCIVFEQLDVYCFLHVHNYTFVNCCLLLVYLQTIDTCVKHYINTKPQSQFVVSSNDLYNTIHINCYICSSHNSVFARLIVLINVILHRTSCLYELTCINDIYRHHKWLRTTYDWMQIPSSGLLAMWKPFGSVRARCTDVGKVWGSPCLALPHALTLPSAQKSDWRKSTLMYQPRYDGWSIQSWRVRYNLSPLTCSRTHAVSWR